MGGDVKVPSPIKMTYLIIILLVGINAAPFLFPQLDIWHAQGIWTQVCILVLFSTTFLIQPKFKEPQNIPLGLLHLWVGLQTAFICFIAQTNHKYDITHFFPYFNFLCCVILYKIVVQYLNRQNIEFCLLFIRYSLIATLFISVFQYFGASQLFQVFGKVNNNMASGVVGFIGNGTHLSGFLAMMIPVFLYYGKREDWLCLILMGILLTITGTEVGNPAISGWVVGGAILSYWSIVNKKISIYILLGISIIIGIIGYKLYPNFFSYNGRIEVWSSYLPLIKSWFVTGAGLGTMNAIYLDSPNPSMRHLHMEYIQFLLEIGIIGVILGINLIKDVWCTKINDNLAFHVKLIFIGFCLSACFNYPAHLWLSAVYAVFAYGAFMVIKRGEVLCR